MFGIGGIILRVMKVMWMISDSRKTTFEDFVVVPGFVSLFIMFALTGISIAGEISLSVARFYCTFFAKICNQITPGFDMMNSKNGTAQN
jgi:hypothetical protein